MSGHLAEDMSIDEYLSLGEYQSRYTVYDPPEVGEAPFEQVERIFERLTPRECEVAIWYGVAGFGSHRGAAVLGMSHSAFQLHWYHIMEKATGITPQPLAKERERQRLKNQRRRDAVH